MKNAKKMFLPAALLLVVIVLSSCAPGNERFTFEDPAGFFMGLWHGLICGISFIISLFNENVTIYEFYNSGWGYDLGFLIGASIIFGGSTKATCRK